MIRKLRQKFVIVTMLLMLITFGALFVFDSIYTKYWDEQEMIDRLEWYSASDSFFAFDTESIDADDENCYPIFAVTFDSDLHVLSIESSFKTSRNSPAENDIKKIFSLPHDNHKWKSYLYTISERPDGYLLVITNTSDGKDGVYRTIGNILLICGGFAVLLIVSLFLSRFVTEPAKDALEREKQFISNASHELKTPLAAISINAQALRDEIPDNKHLQYIISETVRMDDLIKKLLKLSYLDEAKDTLEKKDFSLSRCCEEIVLSMESSIFERKIHFDYDIADEMTYCGNEAEIKQVIAILLDNAMKHTPEMGTISFSLSKANTVMTITVKNTGEGIPAEDLPHIFDRFYRTDKARSGDDGSYGLGLSIAKAIIDAHQGTITVESEYQKGVIFTIRL